MAVPLDLEGYKLRSALPNEDLDHLEERYAGFTLAKATVNYSRICAQLAKRYAVPFAAPVPEIVLGWIVAITDPEVYRKRGVNTSDEQYLDVVQARKDALEEIKLAADAVDGLFELPLREGSSQDGIVKGTPLVYSEQSPYTWTQNEAQAGREEDGNNGR